MQSVLVNVIELAGVAGTIIVGIGYLPQIVHLAREKCSVGISVGAWCMWLVADMLILPDAVMTSNYIFMLLQVMGITSVAIVIMLTLKYKDSYCDWHLPASRGKATGTHRKR